MSQSPDRPADPIALIRQRLHKAITRVMDYRQHAIGCGINQTDFCGCGLREAIEALDAEWKAEGAELARLHAAHQELEKQHEHDGLLGSTASGNATALRHDDAWQPIATAPEAERVWIYVPNWGAKIALKTTHPSDGAVWWDGEERLYNPTHWMPLPEAPKD